jgi:hypothetical protein
VLGLPSIRVLERLADGRWLAELAGGDHEGALAVTSVPAVRPPRYERSRWCVDDICAEMLDPVGDEARRWACAVRATAGVAQADPAYEVRLPLAGSAAVSGRHGVAGRVRAWQRADTLLRSLLDDVQLRDWNRNGHFWVPTPQGDVRLGTLYDLRHRPRQGRPRTLCVVPTGHDRLPEPDIWVNLLLMLRHDPQAFFAVAIELVPRAL